MFFMQYKPLLLLGGTLAALFIGCGGDKEARQLTNGPLSIPTAQVTATPTVAQRYNSIINDLEKSPLFYESLQGRLPPEGDPKRAALRNRYRTYDFYNDYNEFLAYNPDGVPYSMVFYDYESLKNFQLAALGNG